MKFAKYNDYSNVTTTVVAPSGSSSGSSSLNRTLWGNEDTGGNIGEDMFVAGSIYMSENVIDEDAEDEDDEETGTRSYETRADDTGGNIYMETGTAFTKAVTYEYDEVQTDLATHQKEQDDRLTYIESLFPIGSILMYAGNITIPKGWHICDGTGGTVDLRKKFVRGAESVGTVGTKGGAESVTLTTANMPSHNHTATTTVSLNISNSADDVPTGYKNKLIPALDTIQEEYYDTGGSSNAIMYTGNKKGDYGLVGIKVTDLVSYAGGATGSATATTTIGNTGSGTSFSIMPPYYDLIYIQRVS